MISISSKGGSKNLKRFFYVGVSPIPQLICTNLALNYPIYLGSQVWIHVWIHVLLKTRFFIENWGRYKPIKTWLHIT